MCFCSLSLSIYIALWGMLFDWLICVQSPFDPPSFPRLILQDTSTTMSLTFTSVLSQISVFCEILIQIYPPTPKTTPGLNKSKPYHCHQIHHHPSHRLSCGYKHWAYETTDPSLLSRGFWSLGNPFLTPATWILILLHTNTHHQHSSHHHSQHHNFDTTTLHLPAHTHTNKAFLFSKLSTLFSVLPFPLQPVFLTVAAVEMSLWFIAAPRRPGYMPALWITGHGFSLQSCCALYSLRNPLPGASLSKKGKHIHSHTHILVCDSCLLQEGSCIIKSFTSLCLLMAQVALSSQGIPLKRLEKWWPIR